MRQLLPEQYLFLRYYQLFLFSRILWLRKIALENSQNHAEDTESYRDPTGHEIKISTVKEDKYSVEKQINFTLKLTDKTGSLSAEKKQELAAALQEKRNNKYSGRTQIGVNGKEVVYKMNATVVVDDGKGKSDKLKNYHELEITDFKKNYENSQTYNAKPWYKKIFDEGPRGVLGKNDFGYMHGIVDLKATKNSSGFAEIAAHEIGHAFNLRHEPALQTFGHDRRSKRNEDELIYTHGDASGKSSSQHLNTSDFDQIQGSYDNKLLNKPLRTILAP